MNVTRPTHEDAGKVVRLLSGQLATLVFAAKDGDRARVQLPSGAYLCSHRSELEVVTDG